MKLKSDQIKQAHATLYQTGPFGSQSQQSIVSNISIPEKGDLEFEKQSVHLGALRSEIHMFEAIIINPGIKPGKISKIEYQGDVAEVFSDWLSNNKTLKIEGNTSYRLILKMDCRSLQKGFCQGQFFFHTEGTIPIKLEVHWAITPDGKILAVADEAFRQYRYELEISGEKDNYILEPAELNIGKIYSYAKTSYLCKSAESKWVFLRGIKSPDGKLMQLHKPGIFQFSLTAGEHLGYYYFVNDRRQQVDSFIDRIIYYDKQLQHYQQEKSSYDEILISIKKPKKKKIKLLSLSEWLTEQNTINSANKFTMKLQLNTKKISWGENKGIIELELDSSKLILNISADVKIDKLQPLSIPKTINLKNRHVDEANVLHGSIPVTVSGKGKLPVNIGSPAVVYPPFISNSEDAGIKKIDMPIQVHLKKLGVDAQNQLPLKIFFGAEYGDRQIFKTKLILRETYWKRTIEDVIGFLSLYKGNDQYVDFEYKFQEDQIINNLDVELPSLNGDYHCKFDQDMQLINFFENNISNNLPFFQFKYNGNNKFSADFLTENLTKTIQFDFPLQLTLFTDKGKYEDKLQIAGEILVADLEVEYLPESVKFTDYYVNGNLILKNKSENSLCIFAYYSFRDSVKIFMDEADLKFPFIIDPMQNINIKYSCPQNIWKSKSLFLAFRFNNLPDKKITFNNNY